MADIICRVVREPAEREECLAIRRKIFVEEQGLFHATDCDAHDADAVHIAALCDGRIIGTVRVYEEGNGRWWGGRLAVLKRFRGRAGRLLVRAATDYVSARQARCFHAYVQLGNVNFFRSIGWTPVGDVCDHHGRPHQLMEAPLKKNGC